MAEVLLFHHALGLTEGVHALADRLRAAGHTVHVPDLYEGRRFDDVDSGVAHAQELGFGTVLDRGRAAADGLPEGLVYVGASLGVLSAQALAQTRPGVRGAVLLHACVPVEEFGGRWPDGVPVQIHATERDPSFVDEGDIEAAHELVASAADAELILYPGDAHLFTDSSLDEYDPALTDEVVDRVLGLLTRVASA